MGVREMEQARMKNGVMATDWRLGVRRAGRKLVPGWLDDVNRNVVVVVAVSDFPHAVRGRSDVYGLECRIFGLLAPIQASSLP